MINVDGRLVPSKSVSIRADNRAFRYGDAVFETGRIIDGELFLGDFHFDRIFDSIKQLGFERPGHWGKQYFSNQILTLANDNGVLNSAAYRFCIFRGHGRVNDFSGVQPGYVIETFPAAAAMHSDRDLRLGVYDEALKTADRFSGLKTSNFLPYVMGARHAQLNGYDDVVILNSFHRICETTVSNIFWVTNGRVYTPSLSEGCVAGVMRRFILETLRASAVDVTEAEAELRELKLADEIFLTNSVAGIRTVGEFEGRRYGFDFSAELVRMLNA
jgi:branched-chain amino acid aminotransferase